MPVFDGEPKEKLLGKAFQLCPSLDGKALVFQFLTMDERHIGIAVQAPAIHALREQIDEVLAKYPDFGKAPPRTPH